LLAQTLINFSKDTQEIKKKKRFSDKQISSKINTFDAFLHVFITFPDSDKRLIFYKYHLALDFKFHYKHSTDNTYINPNKSGPNIKTG